MAAVAEFLAATLAVASTRAGFPVESLVPHQPFTVTEFGQRPLSKAHTLPAEVLEG